MYTDGTPPAEIHWDPEIDWHRDERFLIGADLFDRRFYWESHEAWEALWHFAHPQSKVHRLLQSLIQYAAATLKTHTGHHGGAARLYTRASERLSTIKTETGPTYRGIDLDELPRRIDGFIRGGPWPTLPMDAR